MGDAQGPLLMPPRGTFTPGTPSGLTPNTRSEAEAALTHNTFAQTDAAAPTTPLPPRSSLEDNFPGMSAEKGATEAQRAYRRPAGPIRTSSTNYENALREARKQSSASSDLSADTTAPENITELAKVDSPVSSHVPFPLPGQGVVPLHTGVGSGQADVVKKARPSGLSLGDLGRKQSWNEQDMKHMLQARLMSPVKADAGYDSGS